MLKKDYIITFIICMLTFFFYSAKNVCSQSAFIIESPIASDIIYGAPLFESNLTGGVASVEGVFSWKNGRETYGAGEHVEKVIFTPKNKDYDSCEFDVSFKVLKRRVYIKFEKDIYKQYDGTDSINLPNYVVGGIVDKTVYVGGKLEGRLESVLNGESKIILSGLELIGDKKDNYFLDLEGFSAYVHPIFIEKFVGDKNRIDFSKNIYVPVNTLIYIEEKDTTILSKKNHIIKKVYDIYLKHETDVIDIDGIVNVKVKIDDEVLNNKKLKVYNYYHGVYEEVDYKYEDGYIVYRADGLGNLVIAQKETSYNIFYICGGVIIFAVGLLVVFLSLRGREKFNKYKSLKRRKENGYC